MVRDFAKQNCLEPSQSRPPQDDTLRGFSPRNLHDLLPSLLEITPVMLLLQHLFLRALAAAFLLFAELKDPFGFR